MAAFTFSAAVSGTAVVDAGIVAVAAFDFLGRVSVLALVGEEAPFCPCLSKSV